MTTWGHRDAPTTTTLAEVRRQKADAWARHKAADYRRLCALETELRALNIMSDSTDPTDIKQEKRP